MRSCTQPLREIFYLGPQRGEYICICLLGHIAGPELVDLDFRATTHVCWVMSVDQSLSTVASIAFSNRGTRASLFCRLAGQECVNHILRDRVAQQDA